MQSNLKVKLRIETKQDCRQQDGDPCIMTQELSTLDWGTHILHYDTQATAEDGWITLEGEVPCCLRRNQLPRVYS